MSTRWFFLDDAYDWECSLSVIDLIDLVIGLKLIVKAIIITYSMKNNVKKRPLRPTADFASIKCLNECKPTGDGFYAIGELAKSTCRTCFGFGHSQKKCPTEVKVRGFKQGNPLVRTVLANFNSYANS